MINENFTPEKKELKDASVFRALFKDNLDKNPEEALNLLNEAIEKELIDPKREGDHKQNDLMHIFAEKGEWEKVKEIIEVTIKSHSQKGRILFYELRSGNKYTGPRVKEKRKEDYTSEEIKNLEVIDYETCIIAIRVEKFSEAEDFINNFRKKDISRADHLSRELMNKYIELKNFKEAKRVVEELTDKEGSTKGRIKYLEKVTGLSYEKI